MPTILCPPADLTSASRRADALSTYVRGQPRQFSGSLSDSFGGGGDRTEVEDQITSEDVHALAAVTTAMPAAAANKLRANGHV